MDGDTGANSREQAIVCAPGGEKIGTHPASGAPMPIGRRFPQGTSGNPNGRPKGHKAVLRELIGEFGTKAYRGILDIAEGRTSIKVLAREPGPTEDAMSAALIPIVEKVPSIRERLDAWEFLAEALNGKATQAIDLHASVETANKTDLGKLDDEALVQLEALLARASTGDVVDAAFTVEPVGLLPEGWVDGEQLALAPGEPVPVQAAPVVESPPSSAAVLASAFPVDSESALASDYVWGVL